MNLSFACPECQTKYSAKPEQAGKEGKCKKCGATIIVPDSHFKVSPMDPQPGEDDKRKKRWFGSIVSIVVISIVAFGIGKECGRIVEKFLTDFESGKNQIYQSDEAINAMLQTISQNFNKQCPVQADKYTILLNTMTVNRKIVYSYQLDVNSLLRDTGLSFSELFSELKEAQNQILINNFCTNPDFDSFKQYDVVMEYKYQSMDGRHLFTLSIDKRVCKY